MLTPCVFVEILPLKHEKYKYFLMSLHRCGGIKYISPNALWPEELFAIRDFKHALGTLLASRNVPAASAASGTA